MGIKAEFVLVVFVFFLLSFTSKKSHQEPLELSISGKPVLDSPDPSVFQFQGIYYLTYTVGSGNIPIFSSKDLENWEFSHYAFDPQDFEMAGEALKIGGFYYCHIWAPEFHANTTGETFLTFTAVRRPTPPPQGRCPAYDQDSGVYIATSARGMKGPFQDPQPFQASPDCEKNHRLPASPLSAFNSCRGGECDGVLRLDQTVFTDQGRSWLGYSWYVNSTPNAWEKDNYGEHISIASLDSRTLKSLSCAGDAKKLHLVNPHDKDLYRKLAGSCPGCGKNLSFTTERQGKPFIIHGALQGVAEGASFFRRGEWVYLLASGGIWDSPSYHVFWIAAKSVEELSLNNPRRLAGRYLIPDERYSYGHGSVISTGQDHYFYIYHRLDHKACSAQGDCRRRILLSPIHFEDTGDGLGPIHIKPQNPPQGPGTSALVAF